jgi:16S rRNA (adenine1518-N6/adenine1519-N6)-dimethyltransferase
MTKSKLLGGVALRELFDKHNFAPSKSLGQNFVIDPNTIRKVVALAELDPQDSVLEIGAGAGSLTLELAAIADRVVAVEFDRALLPMLAETLAELGNVTVVHADAMSFDLSSVEAAKVVANLPYNIATPVVLKILEDAPQIQEMTVMTQREVGQRLVAGPGSKTYGSPSVMVAFHADARIVAEVSRRAFHPVPRVDSVVVRIRRKPDLPDVGAGVFVEVVRAAFGQRRKALRNALADMAGSAAGAEQALRAVGIDPGFRAEQVEPELFAALAREFERTR